VKQIHGQLGSPLHVREDLLVSGVLRAGAVIADGCTLLVHGEVLGTLRLGTGSKLILGGTFGAFVDDSRGTLSVAGAVATPVEMIPGALVVAANSAVTVAGRTALLTADGSLRLVEDVVDLSLSRSSAFRWDGTTGTFRACSTGDFIRLSERLWPRRGA
jgi:hypothetical protein